MNIEVGILQNKKIEFSLEGDFIFEQNNSTTRGNFVVGYCNGAILFNNDTFKELYFRQATPSFFTLRDVVIGKDFHWQQLQNQHFNGDLKIMVENDNLIAINIVDIETYIYSVISSEMSSTSFIELLKAHCVISRSWILSAKERYNKRERTLEKELYQADRVVKWYERESHTLYDVCADDHCQRYQGVPSVVTPSLLEAIKATKGEVLTFNGGICDTRFSKCCGGYSEQFSSCWEDKDFAYLPAKVDSDKIFNINLKDEFQAKSFINSSPDVFCNTSSKTTINQVFNDYDKKTQSFFRWKISYSQKELSEIIRFRSNIDFGDIIDLIPQRRASSGRITELKIVGTKRIVIVGKELEIRKWLSKTHLYSSAFIVEKDDNLNFTITGAGWGHGVGLCQIGAAVMANRGYSYNEILSHYYPNTTLEKMV